MLSNVNKRLIVLLAVVSIAFNMQGQQFGAKINPADYQYSMNITGAFFSDCEYAGNLEDTVAAFVGSDLRGLAAVIEKNDDKYVSFLTIYSNESFDEEVSFKYYDKNSNSIIDLDVIVNFQEGKILGGRSTPFRLYKGNEITDPEIALENDSLFLSEGRSLFTGFQWFYEGKAVIDSINSSFRPEQTGSYFLEATNQDGCTVLSNSIQYSNNLNLGLEDDNIEGDMILYPNPCMDNVYLDVKAFGNSGLEIKLINSMGVEIKYLNYSMSKDLLNLKMDNIPSGTYVVLIQNSFRTISRVIVKTEK